jgi:hypothetical protein
MLEQRALVGNQCGAILRLPHRLSTGFIAATCLIALESGCAQQRLTQDSCVVHRSSDCTSAGSIGGQITVARNGSPCEMALVMDSPSGGGFVSDPKLIVLPTHGSASAHMSNGTAIMVYTPNRDYVGSDRFAVLFGPSYTLSVEVSVLAPAQD